jgi:hypothetical protein
MKIQNQILKMFMQTSFPQDILYAYLDKMTEDELFDFYQETQKVGVFSETEFKIWFNYPRTTPEIITHYIKSDDQLDIFNGEYVNMVRHPNAPIELQMEIAEKTSDPSFINQDIRDIFIFS